MPRSQFQVKQASQLASQVVINSKLGTDIEIGGTISRFPIFVDVVAGTWAWATSTSELLYGTLNNWPNAAINDEITFQCYLSAGTYAIRWWAIKTAVSGICHVRFDGLEVGTQDMYAAVNSYNNIMAITGISVATNGLKLVSFKMASKNGSSTNYRGDFSGIEIIRTA